MSNVVSLERTWEYLVERAARHRRAGRYDEAMTLLTRAKAQVGLREEIEMGLARAYDEMGCEEAAERAYLRVARLGGEKRAEAYFQLALSSAQRADLRRACSYFERFLKTGGGDISQEAAGLPLPTEAGKLLVSLSEKQEDAVAAVRKFVELGFEVVATEGTAKFLSDHGVAAKAVAKIGEGRPDVLDAIKNREVTIIINTPSGRRDARADDCRIRQAAIKYKIPYLTTLAAAVAASEGIAAAMSGKGEVRSLQSYHAAIV